MRIKGTVSSRDIWLRLRVKAREDKTDREREGKREREHNVRAFHLPQGQWSIPPDAHQHYPYVCVCLYESVPQTESSKASFSQIVDGRTEASVS